MKKANALFVIVCAVALLSAVSVAYAELPDKLQCGLPTSPLIPRTVLARLS